MIEIMNLQDIPGPMDMVSEFKRIHPVHWAAMKTLPSSEVLAVNFIAQVAVASLLNNPSGTFQFSLPQGSSEIEVLGIPTFTMLPSLFDMGWLYKTDRGFGCQIKGLSREGEDAFKKLAADRRIDLSILHVFRKTEGLKVGQDEWKTTKAYRIIASTSAASSQESIITRTLQNKFLLYLLTQAMYAKDVLSIPLLGWSLAEIQENKYFDLLSNLFEEIYFIGVGELWTSTHLVLKGPLNINSHTIYL